jgi:hypothetical protein
MNVLTNDGAFEIYDRTNNAARIHIETNGYIGMGTTDPSAELHVRNPGSNADLLIEGGSQQWDLAVDYSSGLFTLYQPSAGLARISVNTSGNVGIGTNTITSGYKLQVNGKAIAVGGTWDPSDQRFKKNIVKIEGALEKVMKMNGKSYEFRTDEFKAFNFNSGKNFGLIAQELINVLPETVHLDSISGYYSVNYSAIIPVLIEAIKEQNSKVDSLQKATEDLKKQDSTIASLNSKIKELQTIITDCCNKNQMEQGKINNNNSNSIGEENNSTGSSSGAMLYQNNPNPFNQQTNIQYSIPATSQSASMMVFDLNGKLMKTIPITNFGNGSINLHGNELYAGMFVYSLVVDGKIVDTKRMILTQ